MKTRRGDDFPSHWQLMLGSVVSSTHSTILFWVDAVVAVDTASESWLVVAVAADESLFVTAVYPSLSMKVTSFG